MKHKHGCPAEGGYGHGKEQCICGADSAPLPSEPQSFAIRTGGGIIEASNGAFIKACDYDALRAHAMALAARVAELEGKK